MNDDSIKAIHRFNASLPQNAVRIYRPDPSCDLYCVFSPWAETISRNINASLRDLPLDGANQCVFVEFNGDTLKESISEALPESTVIEVYTEKTLVKRGMAMDKSIFDDFIFRTDSSTMTLRVQSSDHLNEHTVHVFCAYANLSLRVVGVSSFYDQKSSFQNLKSFLCMTQARDVVIETDAQNDSRGSKRLPSNSALRRLLTPEECQRFEGIIARHNAQFTGKAAATPSWQHPAAVQLVEKICHAKSVDAKWLTDCPSEVAVTGGLIDHLQLMHEDCNFSQYRLRQLPLNSYLAIDENAIEALHLFSDAADSSQKSVFELITAYCTTKMGSRLLRFYLSQPLRNIDEILHRQEMVTVFVEDDYLRETISRGVLRKIPDVDMLLKRFQRRQGTLKDVATLKTFVDAMIELCAILKTYNGAHAALIQSEVYYPLVDMCEHYQRLTSLIFQVLEDADPYGHVVRIRPQFDAALQSLDEERAHVMRSIEQEYQSVLSANGWSEKVIKLETVSQGSLAFRITRKEDKLVRGRKGFEIVQTLKDSTRFVSPNLQSLNAELKEVTRQYENRQKALEEKLLEIVRTYRPALDDGNDFISKLDVFSALGMLVVRSRQDFCRPTFNSQTLKLEGVRHFILGQTMDVVENDICFRHFDEGLVVKSEDLVEADSGEMYIVTGPNMGGKSTLMRAVALSIILAQIGSYVPCRAAQICVRDSILTRVGANDSILHGLSTFMVEMQEANHIVANATRDSFLIIDELGRGTSTYDGFGLAYAIAEHIATRLHSFTMISTHFHEMTYLPENLSTDAGLVKNVHMSATCSSADIHFPYKLAPGPILKSFGLHVAKVSRFPTEVLEYAEEKATVLERSMSGRSRRKVQFSDHLDVESNVDAYCPSVLLSSYLQSVVVGESREKIIDDIENDSQRFPMLRDVLRRMTI